MANFRQQYIARCVGDEREANIQDINKLLDPKSDYNLEKIREFSWMFKIPPVFRRQMWMALLHIAPEYRENDERVIASRLQEAEILFGCLRTTRELECYRVKKQEDEDEEEAQYGTASVNSSRRSTMSTVDGHSSDSDSVDTVVDGRPTTYGSSSQKVSTPNNPSPVDMAVMILLAQGRINEKYLLKTSYSHYTAVTGHMMSLCGPEHWADAFQLSRAALRLLERTYEDEEIVFRAIREIHRRLSEMIGENSALCERSTFARLPIRQWLLSGGALIVRSHRSIQRFWDKLLTGDAVTVLMHSLIVDYLATIDQTFGDEIPKTSDYRLTDDGELRMMRRVLDKVAKTGGRKSSSDLRQRRFINIL